MKRQVSVSDLLERSSDEVYEEVLQRAPPAIRHDVGEQLDDKLSEWRAQALHQLRKANPFASDQTRLDVRKSLHRAQVNTLQEFKEDLKQYSLFAKVNNLQPDAYWQQQLDEFEQPETTSTPRQLQFATPTGDPPPTLESLLNTHIQQEHAQGKSEAEIFASIKLHKPWLSGTLSVIPKNYEIKRAISSHIKHLDTTKDRLQGLRGAILKKWQQDLDRLSDAWDINQLETLRTEVTSQLIAWIEAFGRLHKFFTDLSLQPGSLFDLSPEALTQQDAKELQRWAEYIEQDRGVRDLCDMLGRLRRSSDSQREAIARSTKTTEIQSPDATSKGEITGVMHGNDLENVTPAELSLLADEATSILFDLKYIERGLLCFEGPGVTDADLRTHEVQTRRDEMGPIIICVDTSGSMAGTPETIAKAVTLVMATRALQQARRCYLINFSTSIDTVDLSKGVGLLTILEFLQMSFHGGTDAAPALVEALMQLQRENYKQADVLIVSDFVMRALPKSTVTGIERAKSQQEQVLLPMHRPAPQRRHNPRNIR